MPPGALMAAATAAHTIGSAAEDLCATACSALTASAVASVRLERKRHSSASRAHAPCARWAAYGSHTPLGGAWAVSAIIRKNSDMSTAARAASSSASARRGATKRTHFSATIHVGQRSTANPKRLGRSPTIKAFISASLYEIIANGHAHARPPLPPHHPSATPQTRPADTVPRPRGSHPLRAPCVLAAQASGAARDFWRLGRGALMPSVPGCGSASSAISPSVRLSPESPAVTRT